MTKKPPAQSEVTSRNYLRDSGCRVSGCRVLLSTISSGAVLDTDEGYTHSGTRSRKFSMGKVTQ